ncbi:MAG: hypothetical protein SFZ23_03395 [Planctomycetota bacterium]|nr:hypothetical protein [Planctomycetota bacterium]
MHALGQVAKPRSQFGIGRLVEFLRRQQGFNAKPEGFRRLRRYLAEPHGAPLAFAIREQHPLCSVRIS